MHYYSEKQDTELKLKKVEYEFEGVKLKFYLASGVFSKKKIDRATDLLLNTAVVQEGWKILDMGCGDGIIGIAIARVSPECSVVLSDINERAVFITKKNAELNNVKVKVVKSNVYENIKGRFNLILINPPMSAGKEVCFKMITDSRKHLIKNGVLQIVARNRKGGKSLYNKMFETFGNCNAIAKSGGFWVYVSQNA